jgi:hypothetical protein
MRYLLALALTLAGCQTFAGGGGGDGHSAIDASGGGGGGGGGAGTNVFAATTTKVVVEIDYEAGQQPYTGQVIGFGETFEPTVTNIGRLFAGKKTLTLPTALPAMSDIGAVDDEQLTVEDILALAATHRNERDAPDTKTYYVVFVSGHFADGQGERPNVLGVAIGDTIAMFKDVIRKTASLAQPNAERFVEQATLIHELAHSIGLVSNGVPMVEPHRDTQHGAHCDNADCVMYWLNEGASEARDFALRRLLGGDTILFDTACLADVDALTGGP